MLWHGVELGAAPEQVLHALIAHTDWRAESISMFGKRVLQPRLVALHGDQGAAYRYSGITLQPTPWSALLLHVRRRVEAVARTSFSTVLLNWYRNERDSMGLHSDDEPELGPEPVIASLSLGAERSILFRPKPECTGASFRFALPDASLLIMRGTTQRFWKHGLEKCRTPCQARVNLTFRAIQPR